MSYKKQKLELTWYNKDKSLYYDPQTKKYEWVDKKDPRVSEPRILVEKATYGYKNTENILIKGDNLLALKALQQDFENKIKLIYIDPPFNTGSAFEYYDDGLEHSIWLTMMRDRLEILHKLLTKDGFIFVHIDKNEFGHLKVLMDEIFLPKNFIQVISEKRASPAGFKTINPGPLTATDFILMYAKNKEYMNWKPQYIPVSYDENYDLLITNFDSEKNPAKWRLKNIFEIIYEKEGFKTWRDAKDKWGADWQLIRSSIAGSIALENAHKVVSIRDPHKPSQAIKQMLEESKKIRGKIFILQREGKEAIYFLNGGALSFYKNKIREINGKKVPTELLTDLWIDMNYAGIAKEGGVQFKNSKKPEMLLKRIIEMSTEPKEYVLDSFAGSGTTGAVAHKMGRNWIMVEMGDHANTHIIPRLKRVVSGEDQSGISKEVNWKGGGGFKYFELGESLFVRDKDLKLTVINPKMYNGPLIRAVLKIEGFRLLNPDNGLHGVSGTTVAHVTEQYLSQNYVDALINEVGNQAKYIVIYAKTISRKLKLPDNVEVKRIPDILLKRFNV
jgi:adenine-specific DNA-methyltransferase